MATLTKEEKAWVKKLNALLANCPSNRIAFATIGDRSVSARLWLSNEQRVTKDES